MVSVNVIVDSDGKYDYKARRDVELRSPPLHIVLTTSFSMVHDVTHYVTFRINTTFPVDNIDYQTTNGIYINVLRFKKRLADESKHPKDYFDFSLNIGNGLASEGYVSVVGKKRGKKMSVNGVEVRVPLNEKELLEMWERLNIPNMNVRIIYTGNDTKMIRSLYLYLKSLGCVTKEEMREVVLNAK